MESKIKWQTGKPKEEGKYLITTKDGKVQLGAYIATLLHGYHWVLIGGYTNVVAWCPISEIEPYKE